jgi:hypothetical protein
MVKKENNIADQIKFIGCRGAYCETCPPLIEDYYSGCKLEYDARRRDIKDAKCKMYKI